MSYTNGSLKYGLAASQTDMPLSLGPSTSARPVPSKTSLVNIASRTAEQGPNGLVDFQINTGAGTGYIKPNSMYFNCDVEVEAVDEFKAGAAGAGGVDDFAKFSLPSASASSLIESLTLAGGSTTPHQINDYWILHEMLLSHTTSKSYYDNDNALYQNAGQNIITGALAVGASSTVNVVVPLIIPCFNSEKAFPLFLLNAPLNLTLKTNSVGAALRASKNCTYKIKNPRLVYEQIYVEEPLQQSFKSALSSGNLYQLHLQDFMTLKVASSANLNYQIGANLSSILGVLYTQVKNNPVYNADTVLSSNTQTNFKLLLDGRQINQFDLSKKSQIFAEMNRALSNMFDSNSTSCSTAANYLSTYFVGGVSCNRFNESMAMTGTPAQNINLELSCAGGAFNVNVVVMYNQILAIDAVGAITLIK